MRAAYTNDGTSLCAAYTKITCSKSALTSILTANGLVTMDNKFLSASAELDINTVYNIRCADGKERTGYWRSKMIQCRDSGAWQSPSDPDQIKLAHSDAMCTTIVTKVEKKTCTHVVNGKSYTFHDSQSWAKGNGDTCGNRCSCADGSVTCETKTCTSCTKEALKTVMETNHLMYYASYYEKYVQDITSAGRYFYFKCQDNFNHVNSGGRKLFGSSRSRRRRVAKLTLPTYAQRFRIQCKADGTWIETDNSNCVSSTTKKCLVTVAGKEQTFTDGETAKEGCNSCTCKDGTCTMSTNVCVTCNNVDVTTLKTTNNLIHASYPLAGTKSAKGAKTSVQCAREYSFQQSLTQVVVLTCGDGGWTSSIDAVQSKLSNNVTPLCVQEEKCSKTDLKTLMTTHKMEIYPSSLFEKSIPADSKLNYRTRVKCLSGHTHPSQATILTIKCSKTSGSNSNNVAWTSGSAWQSCVKAPTCSNNDLVNFMNTKHMQYYSASSALHVKGEHSINYVTYLKCKLGYTQETLSSASANRRLFGGRRRRRSISSSASTTTKPAYTLPTYVQCSKTGTWDLHSRSKGVTCAVATCAKKDLEALMASNNIELASASTLKTDTAAIAAKLNVQCKSGQKVNPLARTTLTSFELQCGGSGWSSKSSILQYILSSTSRQLCVACGCECVKCAAGSAHACCKDYTCTTTDTWSVAGVKIKNGKSLTTKCTEKIKKTATCNQGRLSIQEKPCATCTATSFNAMLTAHNLVRNSQMLSTSIPTTSQTNVYQRVECQTGYSMHRDAAAYASYFSRQGLICGADGKWTSPYSLIARFLSITDGTTQLCTKTKASCVVKNTMGLFSREVTIRDGQKYNVECNACECIDGTLSCDTKICGCLNGKIKIKHGQRYKDGCNTCICNSGGPARCTRMQCKSTCQKKDIQEALLNTANVQWLSTSYSKYIRDDHNVGSRITFRCKNNHRNSKGGYFPYIQCLTDATTKVTAWSVDTCVAIPSQTPCPILSTMSHSKIIYSDRGAVAAKTAKIGSNVRVKCEQGFILTGLTSYYGRCQAKLNGPATWSNAVKNSIPQCSRQPFRIGLYETKPNILNVAKCPLDKPIYSISNLCKLQ